MRTPRFDPENDREILPRIRAGEVFVFPTDTAYGLGASLDCPDAVRRVFEVKNRSPDRTVPVLTTTDTVRRECDPAGPVQAAIEAFWPGGLTLVIPVSNPSAYPEGIVRNGTLALREPAHEPLLTLLREVGMVTGTSANVAGGSTPGSIEEVPEAVLEAVDFVINGPEVEGQGSTVAEWNASGNKWVIHREGPVSRQSLRNRTIESTREDDAS